MQAYVFFVFFFFNPFSISSPFIDNMIPKAFFVQMLFLTLFF